MRAAGSNETRVVQEAVNCVMELDWVTALGSGCFGFVVGGIVGFYIEESKELTWQVVVSAVSVFGGAGVVAAFGLLQPHGIVRENWFYAVGLAIGFIAGLAYDAIVPPD